MGVRTGKFDESVRFFRDVMSLKTVHQEEGFTVFALPNGDKVEVFSLESRYNKHFRSGPVVGFLVDNIEEAREEVRKSGLRLFGEIHWDETGYGWQHFQGPDGNIYELVCDPGRPSGSV